jgi:hypothetical protein
MKDFILSLVMLALMLTGISYIVVHKDWFMGQLQEPGVKLNDSLESSFAKQNDALIEWCTSNGGLYQTMTGYDYHGCMLPKKAVVTRAELN